MADQIAQAAQLVSDRDAQLKERDAKLADARKKELELLKERRALEEEKEDLELTVARRLQDERVKIADEARKRADEDGRLKMAEKDKLISDMQKQVEELRRKAEQGSQQMQGEVQELELEAALRSSFPRDRIEPVPKGEHGGDVIHRVLGPSGQICGTILWECKRTKNFSGAWLPKLREDQRAAKAEISVLVSHVLPEEIESFGRTDDVWICGPKIAIALALSLRQTLLEVAAVRDAGVGLETKMEMTYRYLTGPQFRQRVEAIVEAFQTMQDDLSREKAVIMKQWAKRELLIQRALGAAAGMYGDLQGIAGKTLHEIEGLDLRALSGPEPEQEELDLHVTPNLHVTK